jgi:subtilisin family serine protease
LTFLCALTACVAAVAPATASADWLTDSARSALAAHADKVPAQFEQWTQYALDDGTLRVIGTVARRDLLTEQTIAARTNRVVWAEAVPGFMARITPSQLPALLDTAGLRRLVPDHPLTYSLAVSARDVRARDAVWSFNAAGGPLGALASLHPALDANGATGKGVTVAVIDSGIDGTHRDFGGFDCTPAPYTPCESRIKHQTNLDHLTGFGFDFQPPTNDIASGHGSHVAGIIGGNGMSARDADQQPGQYGADGVPIGIAPQVDYVSVKNGDTLWAGLGGFGLDWVLAHHAEYGIRAVNNSWGCLGGCAYDPEGLDSLAIKGLYEAGVLVTFASGNDAGGEDGASFSGDSQSPYALSVANYDYRNNRLSSSSSRGVGTLTLPDPATWTPQSEGSAAARRPDIAAPGELVWSTRNLTGGAASLIPRANTNDATGGGSNGYLPYTQMSGTSMATPHVTGAAALLFSACPQATVLDAMRALMASANGAKVLATDGTRQARPFEAGYGALDVRAAIDWLGDHVAACGYLSPNVAPTAAFAAPASATATDAIAFDGGGSSDRDGSIASYAWDFGDGALGTGVRPVHAYARSGTYVVTLTVTDNEGLAATATRTIAIANAVPTAAFSVPGAARALAGGAFDAVASLDRDGVITAYAWDFGDGTTGTGRQLTHAFTWAGDYVVRLTVTDDEGAAATVARTVTVTDTPGSGFKRVNATGLTNHKCDAAAWTFTLKPIVSGDAPASMAITWADGSRQRVTRTSLKSGAATYVTTLSRAQIATKAWVDVPTTAAPALTLTSGPCQ